MNFNQKKVNSVSAAMAKLFAKKKPTKAKPKKSVKTTRKKLKNENNKKRSKSLTPPKSKAKVKTLAQFQKDVKKELKKLNR